MTPTPLDPRARRIALCTVRTLEALDQLRRARDELQQAIEAAKEDLEDTRSLYPHLLHVEAR